jgi:uncharacterized membrane-anchored protein YhcB (DUF1043 family)
LITLPPSVLTSKNQSVNFLPANRQTEITMSENNGTKILLAFIAGAAIGAAIGYFLNSDKKEEILDDLQEGASKLQQDISVHLGKAKEMVDNFGKNSADLTSEKSQ